MLNGDAQDSGHRTKILEVEALMELLLDEGDVVEVPNQE
jgi:hypothetical protein